MKMSKLISSRSVIIFFPMLFAIAFDCLGQNLAISNFSYDYDLRRPLYISSQVIGNGTNSFILFALPMSLSSAKNYKFGYYLTDNLAENPSAFVPLKQIDNYLQLDSPDKSVYGIRTATNGLGNFVLSMTDTTQSVTYYYILQLPKTANEPSPDVLIYEEAVSGLFVGSYLSVNNQVKFNSLFNKYQKYRVQYLSHQFEPALPPMSKPLPNGGMALTIDSVINVQPLEA